MCKNIEEIIVIFGPTASGKTALSVELAKALNAEIISADSAQIYREINVLNAKPTIEEQQKIRHHLLDFLKVCDTYSAADFCKDSTARIEDIKKCGKNVIIAGGTGLYISSLTNNIDFDAIPQVDKNIVKELQRFAKTNGSAALHTELLCVDPRSAEKIHQNDEFRIIRALAHFKSTGETLTRAQARQRNSPSKFNFIKIGLEYKNRDVLYERINKRVEVMLKSGAADEVENILKLNPSQTAKNAIGISEIEKYINREISLEQATELIKQNSRRYAKRQITWFKREEHTTWLNMCNLSLENAVSEALKTVKQVI